MTKTRNYYQILEVEPDASGEKIKEQYLFLVQAWHPDKFSKADQKARADEKTKEINTAYDVLGNPARRLEYDRMLHLSKKTEQKQPPPRQAQPKPAPPRSAPVAPGRAAVPTRKWGLLARWDMESKRARGAFQGVRVFINGRAQLLSAGELVGARVQYFLNGESKGIVDFKSLQHIKAAVSRVASPNGYEIHVLRLPPYEGRPEQFFTPKIRTNPRR